MNLVDAILQAQGGGVVQQLGSQFGLDDEQTKAALSALVPALAAGVHQNAQNTNGLDGLMAALAGGGHQRYVDDPSTLSDLATTKDGNAILGHVLGSKDVSRQVANRAASETGISQELLKKMLPIAATLVMGALARYSANSSSRDGMGSSSLTPGGGGDLMSILVSTLGQSSGQGSMVGDVVGMLGRFLGR